MTDAIYESGFNSSGRFYADSSQALGMTPSASATAAPTRCCATPSVHARWGRSSWRRATRAWRRSSSARSRTLSCATCGTVSRAPSSSAATRASGRSSGRWSPWSRRRHLARPAARRARDGVPAARVGGAEDHSARLHCNLRRDRAAHRQAAIRACCRRRMRRQSDRRGNSLPPRRGKRRRAHWISLGSWHQADVARAGGEAQGQVGRRRSRPSGKPSGLRPRRGPCPSPAASSTSDCGCA